MLALSLSFTMSLLTLVFTPPDPSPSSKPPPPLPLGVGALGSPPGAPGLISSGPELSVPLIDSIDPPPMPDDIPPLAFWIPPVPALKPLDTPPRPEPEPRPPRPLIRRLAAAEPTPAPTPPAKAGMSLPPPAGGATFVSRNLSTILVTASFRPLTKAPRKCISFHVRISSSTVETSDVKSVTLPLFFR